MPAKNRAISLEAAYLETFPGILTRSEKKQVKILQRAIATIAKHGVREFNLGKLARELRMSRSHLQYYFPSVDALMLAMVKLVTATAQRTTVELVRSATNAEDSLIGIVRGNFKWMRDYPEQMNCMLLFFFHASFDPKMKEFSDRIRVAGSDRIGLLLRTKFPGLTEKEALQGATEFQALITGHALGAKLHPSAGELDFWSAECERAIRHLLAALSRDST